ncbi:dimethyl sulfoxide reductase anchor subunit family protein [Neptunicoccus cionae]|uniref:DMSO reductase n=1 Tax=Neptunicoccus cionae TaxID=2035344 RepID=A0A916QS33_9RHOB|nr:DmsC/YnfH family molybdoenzyme membrane anchor subunit [Amylibacter cionae]GGA08617.1 DMSO reductase [Amylibacter cionae]
MHPAPSVIVFTALSGLGFGLLAFLGVNVPDVTGMTAFIFFFIAYALAVGGLIASTFHLGNPQRALKAFTQWRTSWLSREGVFAVLSLCVMGIYAACLIFLDLRLPVVGIIGSILSLISVYCTSMIYGQLKTVPRWNQPLTPVLFLVYALTGGALLSGQVYLAAGLMVILAILQYAHWTIGDGRLKAAGGTIEAATGLGHLGKVRLLESPHSGTNYLLREMAHEVGRKHALKLRVIALLCLGVLPCALLLLTAPGHLSALLAIVLHLVGVFAARWLFFAEAEHVQALYYDRHRAA